jgi:hypothetical protein
MTGMLFHLAGGIGLFLMGMVLLTDGLKSFAGDALRRALVRFTGRPVKAFASGALVTALVQSSSATTAAGTPVAVAADRRGRLAADGRFGRAGCDPLARYGGVSRLADLQLPGRQRKTRTVPDGRAGRSRSVPVGHRKGELLNIACTGKGFRAAPGAKTRRGEWRLRDPEPAAHPRRESQEAGRMRNGQPPELPDQQESPS